MFLQQLADAGIGNGRIGHVLENAAADLLGLLSEDALTEGLLLGLQFDLQALIGVCQEDKRQGEDGARGCQR